MRISVALCTYNGAAHLARQLDSIAAQARRPDELVACDDGSADGTADLLRAFAGRAPFPVRVHVNPENVGSTRNFERAIGLCSGDVIALCDQDDAWLPEKLARLEAAFRDCPGAGLVVSDALLVDESLRPVGARLWDVIPFTAAQQDRAERGEAAQLLAGRNFVTGATSAFHAGLREWLLPIPPGWVHDAWVGLIAAAVAPCRLVREPLVCYRMHAGQQIGVRRQSFVGQVGTARRLDARSFERSAEAFDEARVRLEALRPHLRRADLPELIAERAAWDRARARMRGGWRLGRVPEVVRQALRGRYRRFGLGLLGWKTAAADLVL
jgi:hypothetical protein